MEQDVRWKQRFHNYEKMFLQLEEFMQLEDLDELQQIGFIKCFELCYELAWNLLKDYMTFQGITGITGSRDAFREAFHIGLITNGQIWMDMIKDRVLSVHTYNEETADEIDFKIRNLYFDRFRELYQTMKNLQ